MAKPKVKVKSKPRRPSTKPPAATHARTGEARIDIEQVAAVVRALPQPSEVEVAAWTAQYPAAYAASLAAQTRASLVVGEAWGWIQAARPVLQGELARGVRYPLQRLAFLGRCVLDLAGVLEAERLRKRKATSLTAARTSAEALAQSALADLRSALREAAGRHATLSTALNERLGEKPSSDVAGLLHGLASLLEEWLRSDDAIVRTLVTTHGLGEDDVKGARAHAASLTAAATEKRGVTATDRDSADVTPLEGRVLAEMKALRNALLNARERTGDARIPKLAPGAGTRAIFGRRAAETAADEAPATPAPTPDR